MPNLFETTLVNQPVIREIHLRDYHENYVDMPTIHVWVNITKKVNDEFIKLQSQNQDLSKKHLALLKEVGILNLKNDEEKIKALNAKIVKTAKQLKKCNAGHYEWYANVWSQSKDEETHVTVEQVKVFLEGLAEIDPALRDWIHRQSYALILQHQNGLAKN